MNHDLQLCEEDHHHDPDFYTLAELADVKKVNHKAAFFLREAKLVPKSCYTDLYRRMKNPRYFITGFTEFSKNGEMFVAVEEDFSDIASRFFDY